MKITISKQTPMNYHGEMLFFCVQHAKGNKAPQCGNPTLQKNINNAFNAKDFLGKEGQTLITYPNSTKNKKSPTRLVAVGIGKDELCRELFRICGGTIAKSAQSCKASKIMVVIPETLNFPLNEIAECLTEGIVLGNYSFRKYKTNSKNNDDPQFLSSIVYAAKSDRKVREGMKLGLTAAISGNKARDMANEPGNYWTSKHFAEYSHELSKKYGFKRQVFGNSKLASLKMGGLLGVNQGSDEPAQLIILEYRTGKKVPTLMLVGKGLTFDSGGISLKPGAGMQDMKYDMCGGAAVLACMNAIGTEKPSNLDIVAIVPATANMPGPSALKPGDIVTHHNGKTVEVINTDAEGRLILADALSYGVKKFTPDAVIDLATLTGAVIVGLGHHRSGLMSNDDDLSKKIELAGAKSGEPLWRLPLDKEYSKQIESKVADLKNVGDKGAGTITAGAFLKEFVDDSKWAHIDIAGTAWGFTDKSYIPKGPSGIGVRLLLDLIRSW